MNVGAQVLREKNFKQRLGGQAWSRVLTFYRNCWTVLQCKSVRYVQTPGSTILGLPCPRLLLFGWSAVVIDQKWPARCEDASESRGRGARRSRKAALRCTAVLYFQTKHALSEHLSTNIHPYEGLLMKPDTQSCEPLRRWVKSLQVCPGSSTCLSHTRGVQPRQNGITPLQQDGTLKTLKPLGKSE